MSEITVPDW